MAETPSIQVALARVKAAVGAVGKTERNAQQGFNFRGIDAVVNAVSEHLNKEGVITSPQVLEYTYETVEIGKNRTPMAHVMVKAGYRFFGPAGDFIESVVVAESMDSGDKACAKAMSVAYRIALLQTLNLPTTEADPDSESYERSAQTATPGRTRQPAESRKTPNTPNPKNPQELAIAAKSAKDVEALRNVWKFAGTAGWLQSEIAHIDTGKKMSLQDYLYKRHDELTEQMAMTNLATAGLVSS